MIALFSILAQRGTHEPAGGDGIGLVGILIGVLIVLVVAFAIMFAFRTYSKRTRETGPDREAHRPGHVGRVE